MSAFDIRTDTPGLLRSESLGMTIRFDRLSETTGRISWNIPTPATGCTAENQAYDGIVVTVDTKPISSSTTPSDGQIYTSDPSASPTIHVGDKVGSALVVGSFYGDKLTTYLDITGLQPNTPYYVSGFPTDKQYRYFREGIHAYSLNFVGNGTDATHGSQVIILNPGVSPAGIHLTDVTGLAYTPGTYTNLPLLGGHGRNAEATINVAVSLLGVVTVLIAITNSGFGYQIGDVVTVESEDVSGGATISAPVLTVLSNGEIDTIGTVSSNAPFTIDLSLGVIPQQNRPVSSQECAPTPPKHTLSVVGFDVTTYGDLINEYLRVDEDGDYVMRSTPCSFLGADNYCSIYEVRPSDCERFPYTDEDVILKRPNITLKNSSFCPAVYYVLEKLMAVGTK